MTILVTGGAGQLASAVAARGGAAIRHIGRPEFDFDRPATIEAVFAGAAPVLVINAAAYTAVDAAETDEAAAFRVNRDGPAQLSRLCRVAGIPLIHISTDYVFDGRKGAPYVETDPVLPQGVYGASKLAGEQAVLAGWERAVVLRTSWVHAALGRNFVHTMLNAAAKTDRLRVVTDQVGCPTAAGDLAEAVLAVAARVGDWRSEFRGIFHAAGTGATSWHGFALAIFEEAARYGVRPPVVEPITTADWPTPARRPADSRLDCGKLERVFGVRLPSWREGLGRVIGEVYAGSSYR